MKIKKKQKRNYCPYILLAISVLLLLSLDKKEEKSIEELAQGLADCVDVSQIDLNATPDRVIVDDIKVFIAEDMGCLDGGAVRSGDNQYLLLERGSITQYVLEHEAIHLTHHWLAIHNKDYTGNMNLTGNNELFAQTYPGMLTEVKKLLHK